MDPRSMAHNKRRYLLLAHRCDVWTHSDLLKHEYGFMIVFYTKKRDANKQDRKLYLLFVIDLTNYGCVHGIPLF
jgi:hypothetical protein